VLMLVIAFILFRSFKNKKQSNEIILAQKNEAELQKKVIEEKHHEMTSSINYAKRIQNALLVNEEHWNNVNHFILFQPKDVVSGDFYWAFQSGEEFIWCAADCTGHGVPGAFMSMLGISFLNEIVVERNVKDTSLILDHLRSKIIQSLEQGHSDFQQKDGMDISLCRWNKLHNEIEFSGANNPLCIVRNGTCIEFTPDKMPVGSYSGNEKPFTAQKFKLEKDDMIYVFSDGYADQFGGEKGKKYKISSMKKKLIEISRLEPGQQKSELEQEFNAWKGNFEQLDDICVIGVKVN